MIRIGQLKLVPNHSKQDLLNKIAKTLHVSQSAIVTYQIRKKSIDARKKPNLQWVYTIDAEVKNEAQILQRKRNAQISIAKETPYIFSQNGTQCMKQRPIVIGSGPAGLFCAYMLAEYGYRPIVFERGANVEERTKAIEEFWRSGLLNTETNVQFGEGGAGTFSDGKLNTGVKDPLGRNRRVLEIFVENGAPEEILYLNKPHIGTDILIHVVKNMRKKIISWGGEVHFHSQFVDFELDNGHLTSISVLNNGKTNKIPAETLILATGHSARDTFLTLYKKSFPMSAKAFAVGVRVEHLQEWINDAQYGKNTPYNLPSADYKVVSNLENQRGVYSFCMCPGGFVVNASSEEHRLAVNGMSYHARDGINANSAIIVTVTPDDFGDETPLNGMYFQQKLEENAYNAGNGCIPVQRFEDFCHNKPTTKLGKVLPQMKGDYNLANVRAIFPEEIASAIEIGIKSFDKQIHGFSNPDVILSGVESRTSSPIRLFRNERLEWDETGIFPCGEGAGYAGGITSAAIDGIKVAECIAEKFVAFSAERYDIFRKN